METEARIVTRIPANKQSRHNNGEVPSVNKKRVAAYCRVSTDEEEQESSFENQVSYYTKRINDNPEWQMVGIFADEGISGTQTKKRTEFLKLMRLCDEGKVDLILVKSVSRFARNTLDSLNYVRRLKEKNVAVYFEEEGINSLEAANEVILTLYSSFAQAESESISKHIIWSIRNSFKEGKVMMSCNNIMGYKMGENREWLIDHERARVINLIDMAFLSGMSILQIKKMLESQKIKSPKGKDTWQTGTIKRILQSEKYLGDVLLQKTFVEDMLTHKVKKNEGELPQYYVKDHHPAIRSRETGYLIKAEFARRNAKKSNDTTQGIRKGKYSGQYALSELMICGECGTPYRRVTWSKNGKKKIVWRCINRLNNGTKYCKHSPTMNETALHEAIVRAMNNYIDNKDDLRWLLKESINETANIEQEDNIEEIDNQIQNLEQSVLNLAELLSMSSAELDYFDAKFKELEEQLKELHGKKQNISRMNKTDLIFENIDEELLQFIDKQDVNLQQYNDMLVRKIVQKVVVLQHDKIEVNFVDGKNVEVLMRNI